MVLLCLVSWTSQLIDQFEESGSRSLHDSLHLIVINIYFQHVVCMLWLLHAVPATKSRICSCILVNPSLKYSLKLLLAWLAHAYTGVTPHALSIQRNLPRTSTSHFFRKGGCILVLLRSFSLGCNNLLKRDIIKSLLEFEASTFEFLSKDS